MNEAREITGVFAGDIILAHQQGTAFIRKNAMVAVKKPYDIVITTNSGYPLDQNLYQAIKGVSAASRVVRDGGAVIMAAACADGLPDDSGYANLLSAFNSPSEVLQKILTPGFSEPDQWTVQIQAQIQLRADVFIYSDGLSKNKIRQALLLPVGDIEKELEYLKTRYGNRICVIPEGPQTIAYLEHS
jgi:nickel-dependent lactate racemase